MCDARSAEKAEQKKHKVHVEQHQELSYSPHSRRAHTPATTQRECHVHRGAGRSVKSVKKKNKQKRDCSKRYVIILTHKYCAHARSTLERSAHRGQRSGCRARKKKENAKRKEQARAGMTENHRTCAIHCAHSAWSMAGR